MKKVDKTIIKETLYIACWSVILSLIMQSVFLLIKKWDYTVLLGNILSTVASVGNFFLLGLTVQKAVEKEEKEAKQFMKLSQMGRMFLLFVICVLGAVLDCFNIFATLIPLIFPRIAMTIRMFSIKKGGGGNE
ncbi:MAG: hypothetical protein E7358_06080 [Clostridiales bacterium]|jgi:hypothetical protein|nr:hypothetical protein [Clostridiales bacterium]